MSSKSNHRRRKSKSKSKTQNPENDEEPVSSDQIFDIKTSEIMGRYMISKRNLKPGDVILSEDPLVVGPCTGGKVQCLGCYKSLENSVKYIRCPECGWPLCSLKCAGLNTKYGHTNLECQILKTSKSSTLLDYSDFERMRLHFHAIVPLRCLLLKTTDSASYELLMTMEAHNEIRKRIPEVWETNQKNVIDRIRNEWKLVEFGENEIHNICGILEVNSFEIGQQGINIRGLYPTAFLMSHDCVPNTNHVDDVNFRLTVRASTNISTNQPITLSYAYTLQNTLRRREHLLENKFFECQCQRCSDPTELGTYMSALLCPKCQKGCVLPVKPLDPDADWSCNSKRCPNSYTISAKSMQLLINRISEEYALIDCNDINAMEMFLIKYRNVLHPTHYICLGIKLSLSQLYGKINGFLIHELDDEKLLRKKEICEEIIKVFDIIEPGYTRLRGVTLYEMHAPLMILLTRQFENKQAFSKSDLRYRLKQVVKCLEEAKIILGYEPKNSSEGIMGLAAKEAMIRIKDWEKIVGKL